MMNCQGHVYNQMNMNSQSCETEKKAKWQIGGLETVVVISFHISFRSLLAHSLSLVKPHRSNYYQPTPVSNE